MVLPLQNSFSWVIIYFLFDAEIFPVASSIVLWSQMLKYILPLWEDLVVIARKAFVIFDLLAQFSFSEAHAC